MSRLPLDYAKPNQASTLTLLISWDSHPHASHGSKCLLWIPAPFSVLYTNTQQKAKDDIKRRHPLNLCCCRKRSQSALLPSGTLTFITGERGQLNACLWRPLSMKVNMAVLVAAQHVEWSTAAAAGRSDTRVSVSVCAFTPSDLGRPPSPSAVTDGRAAATVCTSCQHWRKRAALTGVEWMRIRQSVSQPADFRFCCRKREKHKHLPALMLRFPPEASSFAQLVVFHLKTTVCVPVISQHLTC